MEIAARRREILGKKVKALRERGIIPAHLYGPGIESVAIEVDGKVLKKALKEGKEHVLKLDGNEYRVEVREIQRNPLTGEILHVDFFKP